MARPEKQWNSSILACPEHPKQFTICNIPDMKQWFHCHDLITENGIPQNGDLQILARITDNNSTFLKGNTINNPENAMAISTLPVDITLWHRQLDTITPQGSTKQS